MIVKTKADWEKDRPRLLQELREFARVMKRRPFQNEQGLRGVSAFALYWFIKQVKPTIVFEVGVWKGFSTWLIEQAAPDAKVVCFDPLFLLDHLLQPDKLGPTYRSARAAYSHQDFSCADIERLIGGSERPLVFFDDHQNKFPRLLQARDFGIADIIFDDNKPAVGTHRSLEDDRSNSESAAKLEREVQSYEIFPALWDIDEVLFDTIRIKEDGMGFPIDLELEEIYNERKWHSYMTYVRLSLQN
ncbi:MAG TPA: hypothetical protein VNO50_11115 [Pyrinomonadaceae bacterium]|nr:hypothetical protein [Pyrinomonadaceae bacterium]